MFALEWRLNDLTYTCNGANLDNGTLRLDQQRRERLAHEDDGEKVCLKGRSRFSEVDIKSGHRII